MDMSQEAFCAVIYRENAGPTSRDTHFVRACAFEMHMDMSQEAFCAEIYRENAGRYRYHLDRTPGLNTYRKNPFSVATLFGEKHTKQQRHRNNTTKSPSNTFKINFHGDTFVRLFVCRKNAKMTEFIEWKKT